MQRLILVQTAVATRLRKRGKRPFMAKFTLLILIIKVELTEMHLKKEKLPKSEKYKFFFHELKNKNKRNTPK